MIDINFTLIIQAINFFVMLWFLNRFIFRPVLKTVDEREAKIRELEENARRANDRFEKSAAEYEKGVSDIRRESSEIVVSAGKEAQVASAKIQEEACGRFKKKLDEAAEDIEKDVAQASATLKKDVGALAGSLATRILGRKVGA